MLVGFRGTVWSGGAFESSAATPEEAAEEVFQKVRNNFPEGPDGILEAAITDFPRFACVLTRDCETGKWTKVSEADMSPFARFFQEDEDAGLSGPDQAARGRNRKAEDRGDSGR